MYVNSNRSALLPAGGDVEPPVAIDIGKPNPVGAARTVVNRVPMPRRGA
jgi:hypothetical protein